MGPSRDTLIPLVGCMFIDRCEDSDFYTVDKRRTDTTEGDRVIALEDGRPDDLQTTGVWFGRGFNSLDFGSHG
jgi:hypothetical protein